MVTRKHILAVLSFLLIAAFALSACQPVVHHRRGRQNR